jgi:hypothetical protein
VDEAEATPQRTVRRSPGVVEADVITAAIEVEADAMAVVEAIEGMPVAEESQIMLQMLLVIPQRTTIKPLGRTADHPREGIVVTIVGLPTRTRATATTRPTRVAGTSKCRILNTGRKKNV